MTFRVALIEKRRGRPSPAAHAIAALVVLSTVVVSSELGAGTRADDAPSASEILASSKTAMSRPLKDRLVTGGVEMVVYQKMLPDGTMATLSETSTPIKKISIVRGEDNYDLFLERRLAIDTKVAFQPGKDLIAAITSKPGVRTGNWERLAGTVKRNGVDCYVIESALPAKERDALSKVVPAGTAGLIPAMSRQVIDKRTWLVVETESLSSSGASLSKVELKDITAQPDLADDFFVVPANFEIKKPASMTEYLDLMIGILTPKSVTASASLGPLTARVAPPAKAAPSADLTTKATGPPPTNSIGPWRRTAIVVFIVIPLVLLAVIVIRLPRKS